MTTAISIVGVAVVSFLELKDERTGSARTLEQKDL